MKDKVILVVLLSAIAMMAGLLLNKAMVIAIVFPIVVMSWVALGAINKGKLGKGYALLLGLTLIIFIISFVYMTMMNVKVPPTTYVLGLPLGTAIMIFVVWLLSMGTFTFLQGHFFESDCLGIEKGKTATIASDKDLKGGA